MLQVLPTQAEVAHMIKAREMETNRPGRFFLSRKNGVMKMVKLTIQHDMLVIDGREVLDMNSIEILTRR